MGLSIVVEVGLTTGLTTKSVLYGTLAGYRVVRFGMDFQNCFPNFIIVGARLKSRSKLDNEIGKT